MKQAQQLIYLDANATTPVLPAAAQAAMDAMEHLYGNPSSSHDYGIAAREAVDRSRQQIAQMLGCQATEIVFTSGGTESDNCALKGYAWANRGKGNHIITSAIEHPAILNVCRYLETQGYRVTYLAVDSSGLVQLEELQKAIGDDTILISIMHANNEVGTIQPLREISELARSRNITLHTDAAQSIGKIPCKVADLGVDLLTIAGHKLYGPKGVGALYVREGIRLEPLLHGAGHERGRRAGTENVMQIAGLGMACALTEQSGLEKQQQVLRLKELFYTQLTATVEGLRVNGHPLLCLPNTLSISFSGLKANDLSALLRDKVAVSAGAACHDNSVEISYVLQAMAVPPEWAAGTIRFSLGIPTTELEVIAAVDLIAAAVKKLRSQK